MISAARGGRFARHRRLPSPPPPRACAGAVHIDGFTQIQPDVPLAPSAFGAVPPAPALGAAEESDLVRLADVVLGVSGVCVVGLDEASLTRAIATARSVTLNGAVVLHLCDATVDASLVEEVALQCASAAASLLGSRAAVEAVQGAVYAAAVTATAAEMLDDADAAALLPFRELLPRHVGTAFAGSRSAALPTAGGGHLGVLAVARSVEGMDVDRVLRA